MARSLQQAMTLGRLACARSEADEIMVIGGEQIYQLTLPAADRLYITEVQAEVEGDAFFHLLIIVSGSRSVNACRSRLTRTRIAFWYWRKKPPKRLLIVTLGNISYLSTFNRNQFLAALILAELPATKTAQENLSVVWICSFSVQLTLKRSPIR